MTTITSRQELYKHFDLYTLQRKEELNQRSLKRGAGLLKTYLLETFADALEDDIAPIFNRVKWGLEPIDQGLFRVHNLPVGMDGYLDVFTPRFLAFHTTSPSEISDSTIKRVVKNTTELDHVWLSSPIMNSIWKDIIPNSQKYATLRFENEPLFETLYRNPLFDEAPDDDLYDNEEREDEIPEQQVARLEIKQRINQLRDVLDGENPFKYLTGNLTRIRVPAPNDQGRYEYFHYGKLTNRGDEFRGFASHLRFISNQVYGNLTRSIERIIAVHAEKTTLPNGANKVVMRGAPVTFAFPVPLTNRVFEGFIELTFEKGRGPFRLWGNPLKLSGPKVHVYGIDLHLWQPIYLDLTPKRFIVIIPQGTCGNTIHRLTANIKRFLSPLVNVYIGGIAYEELIRTAMRTA